MLRTLLRRAALVLAALLVAAAAASAAYDAATPGGRSATSLYAGPFVRVDGTLVAYRRWGTRGSPVVLLGGFVEPSWIWRRVGPLLGRRHRVFALDLPPFGYTQRRGPYTLASWVALVRGFDRQLGLRWPVLVGHSLGAAVAVGDALADPRELHGIVLLDGDALAEGGAPGWLSHVLVPPFFTAAYRLVTGSDWIFRKGLRQAFGPHPPRLDARTLEAWQRPFRVAGTADAFRRMLPLGIAGVHAADLRRVRVPRLVAWGADDTVDAVSAGRRTAAALAAPFVLLPGAGHLSMLVDPRRVAAAIERVAG